MIFFVSLLGCCCCVAVSHICHDASVRHLNSIFMTRNVTHHARSTQHTHIVMRDPTHGSMSGRFQLTSSVKKMIDDNGISNVTRKPPFVILMCVASFASACFFLLFLFHSCCRLFLLLLSCTATC